MQRLLRNFACGYGAGDVFEKPYQVDCAFVLYAHAPRVSSRVPADAFVPAGVIAVHLLVLVVLPVRYLTQIGDTVVGFIAISVVQETCGVYAVNIHPRKPMRFVVSPAETDIDVTGFV